MEIEYFMITGAQRISPSGRETCAVTALLTGVDFPSCVLLYIKIALDLFTQIFTTRLFTDLYHLPRNHILQLLLDSGLSFHYSLLSEFRTRSTGYLKLKFSYNAHT
jgi:hypothetical protein